MMQNKLVDVRSLVRKKYRGRVPGFVLSFLERLVHQNELNRMMLLQDYVGGVDFSLRLLRELDLSVEIVGVERIPSPGARLLFASNHPLGGADGMILTAVLGSLFGKRFHVMVTDLLMQVWQMRDVFVPINQYGAQSRQGNQDLTTVLSSDDPLLTFPSGAVSRKSKHGAVRDRAWRPSFAKLAKRYERDIVPIFFGGTNSDLFYRVEMIRERLGIAFNFGTLLLPHEFLGSRGHRYTIYIGDPIPHEVIPMGQAVASFSHDLQELVYALPARYAGDERILFTPPF